MFGCCVAGRPLQTELVQVDETHAYFELVNASSINHVCICMIGVPFPEGYGATIHFYFPGKGHQLLGMLTNEKSSAIFRLRGAFTPSSTSTPTMAQTTFSSINTPMNVAEQDVTAILGLAVEPLEQIAMQMQNFQQGRAKPGQELAKDPALLAEKIVKHLLNYLSSFTGGSISLFTPDISIPMAVIVKWYESFTSKIRAGGIGFLERSD